MWKLVSLCLQPNPETFDLSFLFETGASLDLPHNLEGEKQKHKIGAHSDISLLLSIIYGYRHGLLSEALAN